IALTSPSSGQMVSGTTWANIWINSPGTAPFTFTLTAAGATVWSESQSVTHVTLPWITTNTPDGPQTLTVTVRDNAGATGPASVNVIVQNGGGTPQPLAAAFTSPASGATVASPVTVGMSASGGSPAYTYTLTANGSQVFSQTTTATTTSFTWTPTTNGSYTLGLTITDAGARTATATRTVTVNNGGGGGTLAIALTSPSSGQTVSGTTWANIWINSPGTAPFTFTLTAAGATVWSESQSATHVTLPWITTNTPDGPQTLTVTVRDSAGATGTASVNVIVQNGAGSAPPPLAAAFTSPAPGATVASPVTVGVSASGGSPPYPYPPPANGSQVFSQTTTAPTTSFPWSPTANGSYTLGLPIPDAAARTATATR